MRGCYQTVSFLFLLAFRIRLKATRKVLRAAADKATEKKRPENDRYGCKKGVSRRTV